MDVRPGSDASTEYHDAAALRDIQPLPKELSDTLQILTSHLRNLDETDTIYGADDTKNYGARRRAIRERAYQLSVDTISSARIEMFSEHELIELREVVESCNVDKLSDPAEILRNSQVGCPPNLPNPSHVSTVPLRRTQAERA